MKVYAYWWKVMRGLVAIVGLAGPALRYTLMPDGRSRTAYHTYHTGKINSLGSFCLLSHSTDRRTSVRSLEGNSESWVQILEICYGSWSFANNIQLQRQVSNCWNLTCTALWRLELCLRFFEFWITQKMIWCSCIIWYIWRKDFGVRNTERARMWLFLDGYYMISLALYG